MTQSTRGTARLLIGWTVRSTILHFVTYLVIGAASYWLVARQYWTGPEALPWLRNPEGEFVQRWFLPAQVVRGALLGIALFPVRRALLSMQHSGGIVIAGVLLLVGSIAGISGNIETWVYTTTFDFGLFLAHLPEIVVQTVVFGYLLLAWERRADRKRAGGVPMGSEL